MNGWNTIDSFGARPIFRGRSMLLLYFREGNFLRELNMFVLPFQILPIVFQVVSPGLVIHLQLVVSRPWYSSDVQTWLKVHNYTRGRTTITVIYGLSMLKKKKLRLQIPPDFS